MKAALIIEMLKSRLRDKDYTNPEFSLNELLDCINSAYFRLCYLFEYNKNTLELEVNQGQKIQLFSISKILQVKVNNKYVATQRALKEESLGVYTALLNGTFLITYLKQPESLQDLDDEIDLSDFFTQALVYGALCLLLEIETAPENLSKIQLYKTLYKQELAFLTAQVNSLRENTHQTSRLILI